MKKLFFAFSFICIYNVSFAQSDTSLIISEIMFNPQSGNNEFIEIYNRSETQSFDLVNYKIIYYTSNADVITSAGFGLILPPKSYAVILEGDYDLSECKRLMQRNSRHYAKRQLTWFRADKSITWLDGQLEPDEMQNKAAALVSDWLRDAG